MSDLVLSRLFFNENDVYNLEKVTNSQNILKLYKGGFKHFTKYTLFRQSVQSAIAAHTPSDTITAYYLRSAHKVY